MLKTEKFLDVETHSGFVGRKKNYNENTSRDGGETWEIEMG